MATSSDALVLDQTYQAFLKGPVAINVASSDLNGTPSVARAYGCRMAKDGRRVTVFLPVALSGPVLHDLRRNRSIAVVFCRPSTHQTIQLKGSDAAIVPLARGDRALIAAYAEAFMAEIAALGYKKHYVNALVSPAHTEAMAVAFTPSAAFVQTPGPGAGERLATRP